MRALAASEEREAARQQVWAASGRRGARMVRERRNGWKDAESDKRAGLMPQLRIVTSDWENLLREIESSEADAVRAVGGGRCTVHDACECECARRIRRFVESNCTRRYVPEAIVNMLGFTAEVEREAGTLDIFQMSRKPRTVSCAVNQGNRPTVNGVPREGLGVREVERRG